MSGGIAYVFDEKGEFTEERCNLSMVDLEPVIEPKDVEFLHSLISRHHELTGSRRAKRILDSWLEVLPRFIKVFPHEFKRVLGVSRSQQPYVPGASLPVPVAVEEQVQHG